IDQRDPEALAGAILGALDAEEHRTIAASHNVRLIKQRADREVVMQCAEDFYRQVTDSCQDQHSTNIGKSRGMVRGVSLFRTRSLAATQEKAGRSAASGAVD